MPELDAFDNWIKDFRREVDSALDAAGAPALESGAPAARQASPEGPRQGWLAEEWPARLEQLAQQRVQLLQRAEAAESECRVLRERLSVVQSEIAALDAKVSRSRQAYEEHIRELEARARRAEERLKEQGERELREDAERQRWRERLLEDEEALAREKARAEASVRRLSEAEADRAKLQQELAQQKGGLEELRRLLRDSLGK
ncbi:MAG: hypothetical protein KGO96_01145 [Elusimicrobia bacterium]|nr:hypothetical protein [Elusimicrobiota bacterium]MDE2236720.1 hypothetical protein [Elusimicrobiota bacterium]MDE2424500.1 hypothetical protein [Elusimicrobiota bacterium]